VVDVIEVLDGMQWIEAWMRWEILVTIESYLKINPIALYICVVKTETLDELAINGDNRNVGAGDRGVKRNPVTGDLVGVPSTIFWAFLQPNFRYLGCAQPWDDIRFTHFILIRVWRSC
jgi:hypothetical protein